MTRRDAETGVIVWDRGLRLFHWMLVATVLTCLLTGLLSPLLWLRIHLIAGALIGLLLFWRVVWGVFGTAYARFASFAYSPRAVLDHLHELGRGHALRHLGHNPLGAMMVFALLLVLATIAATGLAALGGVDKQGPLAAAVNFAAGSQLLEIHRVLAWLLVAMIAAHVVGVLVESWRTHENLTGAMLTGRKPAELIREAPGREPRTRLASVIVIAGSIGAAVVIAGLAELPARGVPPATPNPTFALQCGACHFAYPPSLAPAAVWGAILDDPLHHFGANASLGALADAIRSYMLGNSAEHWDTLPAIRFRPRDPTDPLRITATPFWREIHAGIPASVFAAPKVGGKGACDACHRDAATGLFAPQEIVVPVPW